MAKKRLGKKEKAILKEEQDAAEVFLCAHLKPKGKLEQIPDGKDDVFLQMKFADMKTLLYLHAIERLTARIPQIQKANQQQA